MKDALLVTAGLVGSIWAGFIVARISGFRAVTEQVVVLMTELASFLPRPERAEAFYEISFKIRALAAQLKAQGHFEQGDAILVQLDRSMELLNEANLVMHDAENADLGMNRAFLDWGAHLVSAFSFRVWALKPDLRVVLLGYARNESGKGVEGFERFADLLQRHGRGGK